MDVAESMDKVEGEVLQVPFSVFSPEAVEAHLLTNASTTTTPTSTPIPTTATSTWKVDSFSWGRSDLGCLFRKQESSQVEIESFQLTGRRQILQIASNAYHSAAVTVTGDLYMCGSNDEGQVDPVAFGEDGKFQTMFFKPRLFESIGQHRVTHVACGLYHTVCITATGHAISFGGNESGQLGHSSSQISKVKPKLVDFHWHNSKPAVIYKAYCGDYFTVLLSTSGDVYSCGVGACTGHLSQNNTAVAEKIITLLGVNITQIATGSSHAVALSSTGELYGWGNSSYGQLGIGDCSGSESRDVKVPKRIVVALSSSSQVCGVTAGYSHSLIWDESGRLYGTGLNKNGQLGLLNSLRVWEFTEIPLPYKCIYATSGTNHSLITCEQPGMPLKLFGFGSNTFGQIMKSSTSTVYRQPTDISSQLYTPHNLNNILYTSAGGDQSFVVANSNVLVDMDDMITTSPSTTLSPVTMKRQFSTLASRAVLPITSTELNKLITQMNELTVMKQRQDKTASDGSGNNNSDYGRELNKVLSLICEIFSSSSLLAGSFIDSSNPMLHLDINGIEACYKAILQLGTTAVVRLHSACQQSLLELESAGFSVLSESAVRVVIILWQSPLNANATLSADLFKKLLSIWSKLSFSHRQVMIKAIMKFPLHLLVARILKPLQDHLSMYIESHRMDGQGILTMNGGKSNNNSNSSDANSNANTNNEQYIRIACECIDWLYRATTVTTAIPATPPLDIIAKDLFYNRGISQISDDVLVYDFLAWSKEQKETATSAAASAAAASSKPFHISNYPYLLSVEAKQRLLMAITKHEQLLMQQLSYQQGINSGSDVFMPYFIIIVQREHLLHQTLSLLASASNVDIKKPIKVKFEGEEGVDEGGVTKEYFQLLIGKLLAIDYGMFCKTPDDRFLWINKDCTWSNDEYKMIGTAFGLAVYNNVLLDLHFPMIFYQKLLQSNYKPTLDDVQCIDAELHKGLKQLLEYEPKEDVEHIFCRTFDMEWNEYGHTRTHPLIPNGSDIPVTGENRQLYVDKVVEWMLVDSIRPQFQSLYDGFTRVIYNTSLSLLRCEELELLMIGKPQLNFVELQESAEYINGGVTTTANIPWGITHPTIIWFWEIVQSLEFEDKQKLLLFITGSKKAPLGGLKNLGLKIQRMCPDTDALPTSHTCFNLFMLPEYSSKEKLQDRLVRAINECEGFGLI